MPTVSESYAHCRRVARTRARNFYYSFLLLPREQKDAMCAIYAFMRYADDISDEPDPPLEARRKALSAWRRALEGALKGNYNGDPSTVSDSWSSAAATFFANRFADQPNYVGAAAFVFGNWWDANAMTSSNNVSTTTWGSSARRFLAR